MLPELLDGIAHLALTAALCWLYLCAITLTIFLTCAVTVELAERRERRGTRRDRRYARAWEREASLIASLEEIPHDGEWLTWEEIA